MKSFKRLIVVILCIVVLFFLSTFILSKFYNISLIGDKEVDININSNYFENGYKATFLNNNVDNVKVINNINTNVLGDYEVEYLANFLFYTIKEKRIVHVVDKEPPIIELNGEEQLYLNEHQQYDEPGYSAIDNYDNDLTNKVVVSNNIDSDEVGRYEVVYKVSDSSNNESIKKRMVEVIKDGLLSSDVSNFWLKGMYKNTILEEEDKEYDYFKDTVFLGDSNTLFLHTKGKYIDAGQTWGKNNLNIAQINTSTFTTYIDRVEHTLVDALNNNKPKFLIVSTGINAPLYMAKDKYINETEKFIKFMKENYPDTKIAFVSTFPVTTGTLDISLQKRINELNYYLVDICHKNNVKYINFADEVRSQSGYANQEFFDCTGELDCGFHLNSKGREKYINYIKHLNLGGE